MPPQTLFLTGAPDPGSLEWDSASLLADFTTPVARFAGLPPSGSNAIKFMSSSVEQRHASWRSLDLDRPHLPTGHSQVYAWTEEYQGNTDFFATSDLSFASSNSGLDTLRFLDDQESASESIEGVMSQFYEHSFAVYSNSQATVSQPKQTSFLSDSDLGASLNSNRTSFTSKTESLSTSSQLKTLETRPAIAIGVNIIDLRDIPNAKFIDSIQPQTMTVNLIVGIISVAPPRAIKTRRGAEVELVEFLVGDETKSGFGVNFWLPSRSKDKNDGQSVNDIRNDLLTLRPQDIVLLVNVAISTFRGKVYGQSLRKEMTKVHLLYRNRVDKTDVGGYYKARDFDIGQDIHSQLAKTMQVRDWVLHFVAPRAFQKTVTEGIKTITESLPLDTQ